MNFVTITLDYPPRLGGVATYASMMADWFFDRMRVVVDRSVLLGIDTQPRSRTRVTFVRCLRDRWPRWLPLISVVWRERRSHIVAHHILPVGTACWLVGCVTPLSYTVVLHGMDMDLGVASARKRWLCRHILRRATCIVATTNDMKRRVKALCGRTDVIVVPPLPSMTVERLPVRSTSVPVRLLSVARTIERKGMQRVLRILASDPVLSARVHYQVLGGEGSYGSVLDQMVRDLKLQEIVVRTTNVTKQDLEAAYLAADIFVLPTIAVGDDREGFGIVYLEAAAFGLPCIASRVPGVDEAVVDGETGILVDDDVALHQAITTLVEDVTLRQRMGAAGFARVQDQFRPAYVFRALEERWNSL